MQINIFMLNLEQNFDQLTTVAMTLDHWLQSQLFWQYKDQNMHKVKTE